MSRYDSRRHSTRDGRVEMQRESFLWPLLLPDSSISALPIMEESPWTLDIAQPQILIHYGYDDRESYHHCVLLFRVRGSLWTVLTPDMERCDVDLAAHEYHNLQRLGKFPTFAFSNGLYHFDPIEPGELTEHLRAAKDEAALLIGDGPPAGARRWRFTEASADNFGTVVDPKFLYDAPAFVMLEGHGFVMVDGFAHRVALVDDAVPFQLVKAGGVPNLAVTTRNEFFVRSGRRPAPSLPSFVAFPKASAD